MAHQIIAVQYSPASGPGALDGHEAVCSCGDVYRTSLSATEARRQAEAHIAYFARKAG